MRSEGRTYRGVRGGNGQVADWGRVLIYLGYPSWRDVHSRQVEPIGEFDCREPALVAKFDRKDGFEWGYDGSGPSMTAYALLADTLGFEPEPSTVREFAGDVVAQFPDAEWMINQQTILAWIGGWRW